jgi:hypothetical protein
MKKVVIAIILLLMAGGGVLGGMAVMGMGPLAQFVAEQQPAAAPAPPPPPAARLIDLETMGVPIIEGGTVTGRMFLNLQIDVAPENAERVKQVLPRLQSAFLQELLVYLPRHLRERDSLDTMLLQQQLLLVARRVAGSKVRGVLVKNFLDQK